MIAQVSPPAFASVGWRFYLVFAICGFTNALFFWAFLPETRGIPLEELDAYFDQVPLFVPQSRLKVGDAATREEELRRGVFGGQDDMTDMQEKGDAKHLDDV